MSAQKPLPADSPQTALIIGGGPAGLSAALEFQSLDVTPTVIEMNDKVGGMSRTECHDNHYFDMGGHRFYTKSTVVQRIWADLLTDDFLVRPRLSRIFYRKKYFHYPPRLGNVFLRLGPTECVLVVWSYIWWHIFPHHNVKTFDQWVTNAFGYRMFKHFFESYTEKVWGIPCNQLGADWAKQRIKELSIKTILQKSLLRSRKRITTLIDRFHYPRFGPGMMWEKAAEKIERQGGRVVLKSECTRILRQDKLITGVIVEHDCETTEMTGDHFISSMPVGRLLSIMDPPPPARVIAAASALKHRDFLTVCVVVEQKDVFPDNWIYIHDPSVRVGRIQNFKNWSPEMVFDPNITTLGLEYFCNQRDELWLMSDDDLVLLAADDLQRIGLVDRSLVTRGWVHRVADAYPVYDENYQDNLRVVREFCDGLMNFETVGRNGLHRYNNQDHSMLTAICAARNLALGEHHNVWAINSEQDYLEEVACPKTVAAR